MHAERRSFELVDWNEERIERLKKLWAEGLTASQISERMGGISRNAVIGKVNRLGLPRRVDGKAGSRRVYIRPPKQWYHNVKENLATGAANGWQKPRLPRQSGRITHMSTPRVKYRPEFPIDPRPIPMEEIYVAPENRKGVLDLEPGDCRWGIGDPKHPDFHFCDGTKIPGSSYCEFHARKSVQSAQEIDARRLRAMKAA